MKKRLMIAFIAICVIASMMPYNSYASSPSILAVEQGGDHGTAFGTEEGRQAGNEDYLQGLATNPKRQLSTDAQLIARFQLNRDMVAYQNAFLQAYKRAYDVAYYEGYRDAKIAALTTPYVNGYEDGVKAGNAQGELSAMMDYALGRTNNELRAYRTYLLQGSLEDRFFLQLQDSYYKARFITGFQAGFKEKYAQTHQEAYVNAEIKNVNAKTVSMLADTLYFDEDYVHFVSGAMEIETRTPLMLEFPEGAVYEPTSFKAFRVNHSFGENAGNLVPVTYKYVVDTSNSKGYAMLEAPITLSFEFYGSEYAGIYQWVAGGWRYLPSTITDTHISTTIDAGQYTGGEYAIFVDPSAKDIPQQHLSWARDEIYTMMRRGIVKNAKDYQPEAFLTRAALAEMIYAQLKSQYGMGVAGAFTDSSSFGASQTAIQFAVGNRFMSKDSSGAFNPALPVSYEEFAQILSTLRLKTTPWNDVATMMLHEKYRRSPGLTNTKSFITNAEAAYAFYKLIK